MTKKGFSSVVDDIRDVAHRQLTRAHADLEGALTAFGSLGDDATQDMRETTETRVRIALDRIAELQTDLVEADLIETEMAVRTYERSSFSSGGEFLRSAADIAAAACASVQRLSEAQRGEGGDLERELKELMREVETIGGLLGGVGSGMRGVADNTSANAEKEEALKPETGPGGRIRTVPRNPAGTPNGNGDGNGNGNGRGGGCNCGDTTVFCGDATARGGLALGGAGGGAAVAVQRPRRRRVPEITLAVRVTNPQGDVNDGAPVDIQWTTEGGTAPRVATIELFAPQTQIDHPADFHSIVEGVRDTGTFRWTARVPQGHYTSLTVTSPGNPTALPGFYIRVTVTDAAGQTASDTTPIFAIVRR